MELQLTAEDFQNLVETAMEWDKKEWEPQELRFDFEGHPDLGFIYWVESYTALVICKHFLKLNNQTFFMSWDEATEQWCFITDYDLDESLWAQAISELSAK
jgi:hypothetical protein